MKNNIFTVLLITLVFTWITIPSFVKASENQTSVEPKASTVFDSYGSSINPSYYGGDCALMDNGKGSLQIILQKQNNYNKFWYTYDGQTGTKTFTNTSVCAYSKSYSLPVGKFRCKTIATATVNGITDTRTVYSPELTIY